MRTIRIGILLAGAAASPALGQDNGSRHWHQDQQQGNRGEGHHERQQRDPQAPAQQPQMQQRQMPVQVPQQARGPRVGSGNFGQEHIEVHQGPQGSWGHGREARPNNVAPDQRHAFEGRPNGGPEVQVQRQAYGYRGPVSVERNRYGGWTRIGENHGGEINDQRTRNGGWYGQRGVIQQQQQYRQGRSYAGGTWNHDWRNDRDHDWREYRESHRSVFHLGLYIDPFGYGYQPFGIGYRLSPVYFGRQYWIDPALYQLPYPPPGTQWVRYWNDAVLVDMYTGAVMDVVQGFFW